MLFRSGSLLIGTRRTGVRIGLVRATLEVSALVVGIVLGGTFGVGTVLFALAIGPVVESSFALLGRSPLAHPEPAAVPVVVVGE